MPKVVQLNADVLFIIISCLRTHELIQVSSVCKLFRNPALKRIMAIVNLHTPESFRGFCECVTVDAPTRAPWIRELFIWRTCFSYEGQVDTRIQSANLPIIFQHSKGMKTLMFPHLDAAVSTVSGLRDAVVALRSLISLDICEITSPDTVFFDILPNLRSQLRELSLSWRSVPFNIDPFRPTNPSSSIICLKKLALHNSDVNAHDLTDESIKWTSVVELRLSKCRIRIPVLTTVFPNVRSLVIDMCGTSWPGANIHQWPKWLNVDHLQVCLGEAEDWQMRCPVRRLSIHPPASLPYLPAQKAFPILSSSGPVVLSLETIQYPPLGQYESQLRDCIILCRGLVNSLAGLRYCELAFGVQSSEDISSFMMSISLSFTRLPLICLHITFVLSDDDGVLPETAAESLTTVHSSECMASACSISTVHFLALRIVTTGSLSDKRHLDLFELKHVWWRVIRSPDDENVSNIRSELRPMPPEEGEHIRKRLMDMSVEELAGFDVGAFMA